MSNDGFLTFQFISDEPISVDDLLSEIEALPTVTEEPKKVVEEDQPIMLFSKSKEPKSKKKGKKKKLKDGATVIADSVENHLSEESDIVEKSEELTSLMDLAAYHYDNVDNKTGKELITEGKRSYKKYKGDENEYKKEFAEELTLMYDLLDDTSKFGKSLEKKWKALDEQKSRGISKFTTEIAQSTISAKQTQLSIIKGIVDIKKTVADLKLKAEKEAAKGKQEAGENSAEAIANHYVANIMKYGRGNYIDRLNAPLNFEDGDGFDLNNYRAMMASDGVDDLEDILAERISNGDFTQAPGSKYIEYETRGVKIYVNRDMSTNNWDFIAIDRYGQIVDDYPLPSKRDSGRMRFSEDGTYCTDSKGRQYNVKEYWSEDDVVENDGDDSLSEALSEKLTGYNYSDY